MLQGDPEVFIQREIEVGLRDGVDIRPYINSRMTGYEVKNIRLSLWAYKTNNNDVLDDIVIRESCGSIKVCDEKRVYFSDNVEIKDACPIDLTACKHETFTIAGPKNIIVKLVNTADYNPCIGACTQTCMSYGRFTAGGTRVKKLIIDGVTVIVESVQKNFFLGTFGKEKYFDIEFKNDGKLLAPEMNGYRVMRWGNYVPYGSTKCIYPACYEIVPGAVDREDAISQLRLREEQIEKLISLEKDGIRIPECLNNPMLSPQSISNLRSPLKAGLKTDMLEKYIDEFEQRRLHWLLYAAEVGIPYSDLEDWNVSSVGGFLFDEGVTKYAAIKLNIKGYEKEGDLEKFLAKRYDTDYDLSAIPKDIKKILWCCIITTSITGNVDEDLQEWFKYWRGR